MNENLDPRANDDDRRDALIARIVDGEASDRDWETVESLASTNTSLWRLVALAQRDQTQLAQMGRTVDAIADRVELDLPVAQAIGAPPMRLLRPRPLGAWLGWAVAACVFIALVITSARPPRVAEDAPEPGVITAGWNAQQAFDAYIEKGRAEGRVLSPAPRRVIVETRPDPNGQGYELIYLQQVVERAVVPSLYQINGRDEEGRPSLERLAPAAVGRM